MTTTSFLRFNIISFTIFPKSNKIKLNAIIFLDLGNIVKKIILKHKNVVIRLNMLCKQGDEEYACSPDLPGRVVKLKRRLKKGSLLRTLSTEPDCNSLCY